MQRDRKHQAETAHLDGVVRKEGRQDGHSLEGIFEESLEIKSK